MLVTHSMATERIVRDAEFDAIAQRRRRAHGLTGLVLPCLGGDHLVGG